jgi:hypothetical protein
MSKAARKNLSDSNYPFRVDKALPHRGWFCPRCHASGVVHIETIPEHCSTPGCGQLLVSQLVLPTAHAVNQETRRIFTAPPTRDEEAELLALDVPQEMIAKIFANRPTSENPVTITHCYVPALGKKINEIREEYGALKERTGRQVEAPEKGRNGVTLPKGKHSVAKKENLTQGSQIRAAGWNDPTLIRQKIYSNQDGTISIKEAAIYFNVVPKTINTWISTGKLKEGTRRSSVTNTSIIKLSES